ncbi:MAG: hypothetical protein AAF333_16970 [Planctomycetota bacterium]
MSRVPSVLVALLLSACLIAGTTGCIESKAGGAGATGPGSGTGGDPELAEAWRPQPVALRIYPSTRFVRERDTPLLEARIELFDEMGDSIKSSGQVRFELFAAGYAPGIDVGRLLYSWDIALSSLEDHQRYYDPITRGYLLRLRLDSAQITRREVLLRVTFQPLEGGRLIDEQPVRINW